MSQLSHVIIAILDYYKVTIVVLAILLYSIFIYFKGRKNNLLIATKYMTHIEPILRKYFAKHDKKLIQQSSNVIKAYAFERKSAYFAIFGFALVARQQLLAYLLNDLVFKLKDELVIEIPIVSSSNPVFAMAVLRRTFKKNITKKKYPDLKTLCRQQATNLPDNLMVIAQNKEFLNIILNDKTVPLWTKHNNILKLFYMSDINKFSQYPYSVRMVIELKNNNYEDVAQMVQGLILLVDRLSLIKMSPKSRQQALTRREQIMNCYTEQQNQ